MPLQLNFIPDQSVVRQVTAILQSQVSGPYRFVHNARGAVHVRVEPASAHEPTILMASHQLRLAGFAKSRTLTGPADFVIIWDVGGLRLAEVSAPDPRVLPRGIGVPVVDVVPEGGSSTPRSVLPPANTLTVAPEPDVPRDVTIPGHLRELCAREDIHPEHGDYLVVPSRDAGDYEPRPPWVVATDAVSELCVVKPRLEARGS